MSDVEEAGDFEHEIAALSAMWEALSSLPVEAQARALTYLLSRVKSCHKAHAVEAGPPSAECASTPSLGASEQ